MEFAADGPLVIPLWINGHAYLSVGESFYDVPHAQSGEALRRVPLCGAGEAAEAVAAARAAQPKWATMGLSARHVCLAALADGLESYAGHFAKLLTQEIALDETAAIAEVAAAVAALRASEVGETGIVAVVVDAQRPLSAVAAALAPALLAGAAAVVKPSPRAPAAVFALCELSARVEWPAGVLNLVQGDTAAIAGLCAAGIDRLIYRGNAVLGDQVGAIAAAAGTVCVQHWVMQRIVYLERDSIVAEVRRPDFPHEWIEYPATRPEQVVERLTGAHIAITNKMPLPASAIAALPELKMVAVAATGTNIIDLDACRARGIVVSNIRGYAEHTVPEHVIALLLALSRNLVAWRETLQAGRWQNSDQFCLFDHPICDLHGATLGLIGVGSLGGGVARLAEAFGMRVLRAERKGAATVRPGYTAFAEVLATADAISLHCPLDDDTRGLIGVAELRTMKPSALLINTARGGIVDELALIRALREGWIAGAGFDVITTEPPPAGHPMVDPQLLALPNFLLTPHVAWASRPAMQTLADQLIANIEAFAAGRPQNRVV